MSDKTDAFTSLIVDAANARHDGTTPERAEAARLTLMGKLPPLPPHVALMTQTPFSEVAQVAISPSGKIAVLGIEPDGRKRIVEWEVIEGRWTNEFITSTNAEMRVDHLHYPTDSDNVAFTVTAPDGSVHVFWGDWSVDVGSDTTTKVVSIFCYSVDMGLLGEQKRCIVVERGINSQCATQFSRDEQQVLKKFLVFGSQVKILGKFGGRIAFLHTNHSNVDRKAAASLVDLVDYSHWHSEWYDRIFQSSAMLRDGELSFVGYTGNTNTKLETGKAFFVTSRGETLLGEGISPNQVHCLPSGRILIEKWISGNKRLLRDALLNDDGVVLNMQGSIAGIVETRTGVAIHATVIGESNCDGIVLVDWKTDSGRSLAGTCFGVFQMQDFRRWGDNLVFRVGDCLQVIPVKRVEQWIDAWHKTLSKTPCVEADSYRLYIDFDRLVHTEEGILGWHFVNGTFYIIRYDW